MFCIAQNDNYPVGSRSRGLANASVTIYDVWSTHHNQAGLAKFEEPAIGLHYENKFIIKEYGLQALAFVLPTNSGNFGLSLSFFGYSKYNETKFGLAYARMLSEKISVGIQVDYLNTYIANDYGNRGTVAGEIGIIAEPFDKLFVGVHVYNPTLSKIPTYSTERVPTIFRFGTAYKFSDKLFLAAETEKDIDFDPVFKVGVEYKLLEDFYLRTGINTNPVQNSFGVGYVLNRLKADIAFSSHKYLGITPHFTISYDFK